MPGVQAGVQRLIPLLPHLTMAQQTYLEQTLRDLSQKVDSMHGELLRGQADIRVEVTKVKAQVEALKGEMSEHVEWADRQAEKIEEVKTAQEEDRLTSRLNVKRLDTWAWIAGLIFTALGAALAMAWQWALVWWQSK